MFSSNEDFGLLLAHDRNYLQSLAHLDVKLLIQKLQGIGLRVAQRVEVQRSLQESQPRLVASPEVSLIAASGIAGWVSCRSRHFVMAINPIRSDLLPPLRAFGLSSDD